MKSSSVVFNLFFIFFFFFFNDTATTEIYTLSLHDALPISTILPPMSLEEAIETTRIHSVAGVLEDSRGLVGTRRSEEHTSELQSRPHLVFRLLLEKKRHGYLITFIYSNCVNHIGPVESRII